MLPPVAARGKTAKSDPIYGNRPVNVLANRIVKHAKSEPRKDIQRKTKNSPLFVLRHAMDRVTADIAVKAIRVGELTHQGLIEIGYLVFVVSA